jgi:hypothetical protein
MRQRIFCTPTGRVRPFVLPAAGHCWGRLAPELVHPCPAKTTACGTLMAVQFGAGSMLRAHAPAPWLWAPPPLRRALPCPPPQRTAGSRHQCRAKNVPGACWRRALAGENAWRVVSHAPRALRWRLRFGAMQAMRARKRRKTLVSNEGQFFQCKLRGGVARCGLQHNGESVSTE